MEFYIFCWYAAGAVLAPVSYALSFGHFQGKYPTIAEEGRGGDIAFAVMMAAITLVAPFTFVYVAFMAKHGLKWK